MTFFYDLNKKLAGIDKPAQQLNESVVAEKWDTETKVSPEEKGKYAGKGKAELLKAYNALKASGPHKKGSDAYGRMRELAFAIRAKSDWGKVKEESVEEGFVDTVKQGAQSALQAIGSTLGHGSDEDMIKDLQKKAGVPVTGKVQPQPGQQPQGQQKPMAEDDMEEGNAFSKAVVDAKKDGIQPGETIKVGGKTYPVKEGKGAKPDFLDVDKDGNKKETFKKAVADKKKHKQEELDEGWDDMMAAVKARASKPKVGDVEHGAKHDIEHTATGRRVTRRVDDKGHSVGADDDTPATGEKRGRGRPKKADRAPERVTSKAYKHKGGRKVKEDMPPGALPADAGEYGNEGDMAKDQLHTIMRNARELEKILSNSENLPEWVQSKLAKVEGMMTAVSDYMQSQHERAGELDETSMGFSKVEKAVAKNPKVKNPAAVAAAIGRKKYGQKEMTRRSVAGRKDESEELNELSPETIASYQKKAYDQSTHVGPKSDQRAAGFVRSLGRATKEDEELDEKAVSKAQQRFMGMAHAMQKGEKIPGASKELKKVAKTMKKGDVEDYAKTKHKGLPEKKKKEETDESTVSGSVATSAEAPKSKKGGSIVGKGIYDSLNRDLEAMIAESMNVSVNMSTDEHGEPHKNITVSAEGEAAEQLAQLLNLAGMPAQDHGHDDVCPTCGSADCGCDEEMVDENAPDWPTDPETTGGDDPRMNRWAGGLNKPKETGQTTIPVINRDPRRGSFGTAAHDLELKEAEDLGMNLYAELKSFKAK